MPRRRAGRALFRDLDEAARPARTRSTCSSATGADDTFGWGVVFSDQTVENLMANDPVSGAVDPRRVRPLGRYRRPYPRRDDPLVRPRLHRHRPQAAARASCRSARASSASRSISSMRRAPDLADWAGYDLVIAADGANSRIRDRYEEHFGVDIQVAQEQILLVRHAPRCSTPSPSPSRRPRRAGSGRTPIASTTTSRPSSSRWTRTTWAGLGFDRDGPARGDRPVRADLRQISGRPAAHVQRHPPARPAGVAQFPPDRLRTLVATAT